MSVAAILQALAEQSGRREQSRGALIGNAIEQVSQVPAQMINDRQRQRERDIADARARADISLKQAESNRADAQAARQATLDKATLAGLEKDAKEKDGLDAAIGAYVKGSPNDPSNHDPDLGRQELINRNQAHLVPVFDKFVKEQIPKPIILKEGEKGFNSETNAPIPGMEIPKDKPDYTVNGVRFSGTTNQPYGPATPTQAPPKALQRGSALLDGRPADLMFDPDPNAMQKVFDLEGKQIENAATRVKPSPTAAQVTINNRDKLPPGDWEKTGDAFLASIPKQWQATVKKIAAYEEDATKVASMRGGMRETLMQWVNQANPDYKADEFSNRAPTRKAFTTGTQGQQINAINTAIGHIDQLTNLADQLGNSTVIPVNQLMNFAKTMTGGAVVTNFETLKGALAGEVSSVLSKGQATVSGIKEAEDRIKSSSSPQQLAGYVKTLIPVLGSKLASLNYQYHQAMGENDPFSALSPEVKGILTKHGFDPEHPTIGGSTGSTFKVIGSRPK